MDVDGDRCLPFVPQKELIYNRMLPYGDSLDNEALEYLNRIKGSISSALLLSDPRYVVTENKVASKTLQKKHFAGLCIGSGICRSTFACMDDSSLKRIISILSNCYLRW